MAVSSHWPMNLARMMVVEEARSRTLGCVTNELSIGAIENSHRVPESSERINALARLMPMILSLIFWRFSTLHPGQHAFHEFLDGPWRFLDDQFVRRSVSFRQPPLFCHVMRVRDFRNSGGTPDGRKISRFHCYVALSFVCLGSHLGPSAQSRPIRQ